MGKVSIGSGKLAIENLCDGVLYEAAKKGERRGSPRAVGGFVTPESLRCLPRLRSSI